MNLPEAQALTRLGEDLIRELETSQQWRQASVVWALVRAFESRAPASYGPPPAPAAPAPKAKAKPAAPAAAKHAHRYNAEGNCACGEVRKRSYTPRAGHQSDIAEILLPTGVSASDGATDGS